MAYQAPTASDLKQRFPEFTPVSDTLVGLVLAEAIAQVGDTWLERDRSRAQMLLAAHTLTMEGEPGRSSSGQGIGGSGFVKRRKVGDVEVEFAGPGGGSGGSAATGFSATTYGQQYMDLVRKNFPAVLAV